MSEDTQHLVALVHDCGVRAGRDPRVARTACPFCDDRMDLCEAWLAGFSVGRVAVSCHQLPA